MLPLQDSRQNADSTDFSNASNSQTQTILDMANSSTGDENVLRASGDNLTDSMMSSCNDTGYESKEDSHHLQDIVPLAFKETNLVESPSSSDLFQIEEFEHTIDNAEGYNFESILCQFDTFFRSRLEAELQTFKESMHSLMSEQQIHIQRIISSAVAQSVNQISTQAGGNGDEESVLANKKTNEQGCTCENYTGRTRMGLIMELLSLSCQISALLNLPKYAA